MTTGNGKSVTVFDGQGDSIDRAAARLDDSLTVNKGSIAKFEHKSGDYATREGDLLQAGLKNNDPSQGRRFEVTGVHETWAKFPENEEGKTIPVFVPVVDENGLPVRRETLGDGYTIQKDGTIKIDRTGWEKKFNELQDPWNYFWLIYLTDPRSCEVFTLQLKSKGGKRAWMTLVATIKERRRLFPGSYPIIELRWAIMPTDDYGEQKKPFFKIVGWKINVDQIEPERPQLTDAQRERRTQVATQLGESIDDDIDDELPEHMR